MHSPTEGVSFPRRARASARRAVRLLARVAALGWLGAASARGQATSPAPRLGALAGEVRDSLHARSLAAATVMVRRVSAGPEEFRSVFTDERGRFRVDSLAPGRYAVSFAAPLLDSLDLVMPDQVVELAPGERRALLLATPSATALRAAACPGLALATGRGAVFGEVTDAATDRPLAGATVVVGWNDLVLDRATLHAEVTPRTGAVTTDSSGLYRLCGVPTDSPLALQVQRGGGAGAAVDVVVSDSVGITRRNLSFAASAALADTTTTPAARPIARLPDSVGTATLRGQVRGVAGPVAGVQLQLENTHRTVQSDSLGRYLLSDLPAGTQMLDARRIGYGRERTVVELRAGQATTQDLQLTRIVSLDSIRIVAQRARYPEFEQHRRRGWGRFLDETEILRRNPIETSDLLRMMPGVRVGYQDGQTTVFSARGRTSFGGGGCPLNVIVDGMDHMEIDLVHPSDVAGIEAYPSTIGMPVEYALRSPCGAIIIWTKR